MEGGPAHLGDSSDGQLAGRFHLLDPAALWRDLSATAATADFHASLGERVEFATLEWVAWFNTQLLLEPLGYLPPAEYEAR